MTLSTTMIQRRVDAALGRIPCDGVIRNVRYLDVFSAIWREGDIAWIDGVIVGIEPGLVARREWEGRGSFLVPGFIDAHVHLESSLLLPGHFERTVLPKGTTTAVCDPHELANVLGVPGIRYFLEASEKLKLDLRVMLSSCVPATLMETNGGGTLTVTDLAPLASHPAALGLAEMMNVPGVLHGDPDVLRKLEFFSDRRIDGHCPLVSGRELSAYAAAGISSCHESSRFEEAQEKLSKGIAVWIREGSVAKDLAELSPLLTLATSTSLGFCTDDRNPLDIDHEGHLDFLIRGAIARGVPPEVAYRAASFSVARHYGLRSQGAIAPGYRADLVLLGDPTSVAITKVFRGGVPVNELPYAPVLLGTPENTIRAQVPESADLRGPEGSVHVIEVEAGKILTGRSVALQDAPGVARLSVLERHLGRSKPANAYVRGFGEGLCGAIASSVGHDSHNLIVVGREPEEMRVALAALIRMGGGFCVVQGDQVLAELPLPLGGLMSLQDPASVASALESLRAASRTIGCTLPEPFLQLAFLSLPVIPSLKLTDRGLVDVDRFELIPVRAS
jgi:adenine deaminase